MVQKQSLQCTARKVFGWLESLRLLDVNHQIKAGFKMAALTPSCHKHSSLHAKNVKMASLSPSISFLFRERRVSYKIPLSMPPLHLYRVKMAGTEL